MLTRGEADDLIDRRLGAGFRAEHSRLVGVLMRDAALRLDEDTSLWELVGLCHDLDYDVTRSSPERHGLVAAEWLAGSLPSDALRAIEAHDHRSGVRSDTMLGRGLRLTDALAVAIAEVGRNRVLGALRSPDAAALLANHPSRPWLPGLILDNAVLLGLSQSDLADILATE